MKPLRGNYRLIFASHLLCAAAFGQSNATGIFTKADDIGKPAQAGKTEFADGQYRVTGAGANVWGKHDEFQYVWREMTGNFTVTAKLHFLGLGADHRKAGIMIRQSTDADSAYADVLIHGNGMPALQWRSKTGEDTNTFDFPFEGPGTFNIKMVRTGVKMFLYLSKDGEPKEVAHTEVSFRDPVLVGLVVCSHQANVAETAIFSGVTIEPQAPPPAKAP